MSAKFPRGGGYDHLADNLYVNNLVGDVMANPRDFYRYINSQKKYTQGIPPLKRKNGKGVAQSDLEKAEEFNGQFTDVFSKNEHTLFMPRHQRVAGYYVIPSEILSVRPSVRLSVCPSVRSSAPTTIIVLATPPTVLGQSF